MAGRIPQSFTDELLSRVDIVDVIDSRVKLKKTGKNYSACCPFHDEKTPSFSVSPDKQFYYCFGCGASGNAVGFVMQYEGLSFPEAIEKLAGVAGLDVPRVADDGREDTSRPLLDVLAEADRYYQQQLRDHPSRSRAVNYLKGRGITGQTAKRFGLGYAPAGWNNLIDHFKRCGKSIKAGVEAGLFIERSADRQYDRLRERITFPIRDIRGRTIGFGGRVLNDEKPKYLNSPETPVFHKGSELYGLYEARQAGELDRVLIVEGYMDVIALHQSGIPWAVATLGTATSETHLKRLFRYTEEVIFCFDGDEAGRKAALRALDNSLGEMRDGREIRFLFLPEGDDPDTLVRREGRDGFMGRLAQASGLSDFLFRHFESQVRMDQIEGRAKLVSLIAPSLRKLPPSAYRQMLLGMLASRTSLPVEQVSRLMEEAPDTPPAAVAAQPPERVSTNTPEIIDSAGMPDLPTVPDEAYESEAPVRARNLPLIDRAIRMALQRPHLCQQTELPEGIESLDAGNAQLLVDVWQFFRHRPEASVAFLLGQLANTVEGSMLARLLTQERLVPPDVLAQELDGTLLQIRKLLIRQQLKEERAKPAPDPARLQQLALALTKIA